MTHPLRRSFAALSLILSSTVLAPSIASAEGLTACPPAVDPALAICGSLATPFTDSSNTLGATSTVSSLPLACNTRFETAAGAERLYPLIVGAGNMFIVTVTPAAGFDASVYLLSSCGDGTTCVSGKDAQLVGGAESFGVNGLADGTYYLYVDSFHAASGTPAKGAGDYTLSITGSLGAVASAKVALTADMNPSGVGIPVTYTALVTSGGAVGVGSVTFTVDGVAQTPQPLGADGKATFQTTFTTGGAHDVTATFTGGGACLGDGTNTLVQTVDAPGTGGAGGGGQAGEAGQGQGGDSGAGGSETAGGNAGTTSGGGNAGTSATAGSAGTSNGGSNAGGTSAGGTNAGGTSAGGTSAGGTSAGGTSAGGASAAGMSAGGNAGSSTKGGAGGTSTSGGSAGASATKGGSAGATSAGGRAGAGAGGKAGGSGAGVGGKAGGAGTAPAAAPGDDGGCGCRTAPVESNNGLFALAGLALVALRRRRSR